MPSNEPVLYGTALATILSWALARWNIPVEVSLALATVLGSLVGIAVRRFVTPVSRVTV